jgi:hypothetical protein
LAVNVVLPPSQIEVVPVTVTTGEGVTVMVTVAVDEQPDVVPVTVYVVVPAGDATGLETEGSLRPVTGSQLYEVAPLALNEVDVPEQIVAAPPAVREGKGVTLTASV